MARKRAENTPTETPNTAPVIPPRAAKLSRKGKELSPEAFFQLVKDYERSPAVECQLYRKWPVIDRALTGQAKKSIDAQPIIDRAYILKHWGTGTYTIYFNDHNVRPSCLANTVVKFDLDWDNPPVLDQAELVEGPDNKGYIEQLKVRGLWIRDLREVDDVAEQNQAATAAVEQIAGLAKDVIQQAHKPKPAEMAEKAAIEIMGTAYKAAAQTIAEQRPAGPDVQSVLLPILERMERQQERAEERFYKLLEMQAQRQNPASPASLDSQLGVVDKMLAFAERLGGRSAPASFMDRLPEMLMPVLGPLVARAMAPAPASGPVAVSQIAPNPEAEIPQEVLNEMAQKIGIPKEMISAFMRVGHKATRAYSDGYPGNAFAQMVEKTEGELVYASVVAIGKEDILKALRMLPASVLGPAEAVVQSPEFEAWLDDFMAYGMLPDEDAGEGQKEAVA